MSSEKYTHMNKETRRKIQETWVIFRCWVEPHVCFQQPALIGKILHPYPPSLVKLYIYNYICPSGSELTGSQNHGLDCQFAIPQEVDVHELLSPIDSLDFTIFDLKRQSVYYYSSKQGVSQSCIMSGTHNAISIC